MRAGKYMVSPSEIIYLMTEAGTRCSDRCRWLECFRGQIWEVINIVSREK
jgi:hypothetical protein